MRQDIIEDGALGKKAKEMGHKIRMVRGEHMIDAVWARDRGTLWNALKRLMIPLYLQNGRIAVGVFVAVAFLLFVPFPVLVASSASASDATSSYVLCVAAGVASLLIYIGALIETRGGAKNKIRLRPVRPAGRVGGNTGIPDRTASGKQVVFGNVEGKELLQD